MLKFEKIICEKLIKIEHGSKIDKIFIKSRLSNNNKGVPIISNPIPKIDCVMDKTKIIKKSI